MSVALHELVLCCRQLETDRIAERRKEIVKFKRLLQDRETVQELDRNSDARHGKLNWDTVFRFLQKYIFKEIECIKSAKTNVSQSTHTARQKKMQEISSLVKYFIRCANKRAPRLKCTELLQHVINTVKDSTTCAAYGTDYSSILLKDILTVRKYWCEITPQQWTELLSIYFDLYLKSDSLINRLLVARIIQTLTRGCCLQIEGMHSKFFIFFSAVIQRVREESNLPGLDQIFAALNLFLSTVSMNYRMRVCHFGEDVFPTVLRIWTQHRPKDALKEEIVEFFRLMLLVHHPRGAKTVEEGAYAFDSGRWQRSLFNLYDALMSEISQIGSRGKYSSGSRSIAVQENLVELMADICHQLFTEDIRILEISQASFAVTQRDPNRSGVPNKRRRIELGWEVVRDKLQRSKNDFDVIPWLQIAACLIARHPLSLPSNELTPLLAILHQLLSEQKRGEKATFVLRCLREVALCQKEKTDVAVTPKSDLQKLWAKIWAFTLRSLSSPQTETDSFALLGVMLQGRLLQADRDFWKIFTRSSGKPSSSAIKCLCLALTSCIVPDHLTSNLEQSLHESSGGKTLLKEEIIKWLLFGHRDDDMEDISDHAPLINEYFSQPSFQKSLVSLTIKNSCAAMDYFKSFLDCSHQKNGCDSAAFSDIEELHLVSSFNEVTVLSSAPDSAPYQERSSPCLTVHQCIRKKLERDLLTIAEQLLNSYSAETTPLESLVQCASLLTGVLACYCHVEVITEEEACQSSLFQKAKMLMQYVGESVSILKAKLSEEPKLVILGALASQCLNCVYNCRKIGPAQVATNLFLRLITPRMLTDLYDICRHLMSSNGSLAEAIDGDPMEMDREARTDIEDHGDADFFDDHSSTEATENIESGELQNITGAVSPLSDEHLTKPEMVLSQTLQFLCFCASSAVNHNVNFRPYDIRRRLLNIIDTSLDTSKPLHLRVFLQLLNDLPVKDVALPADDINILLNCLPDVCSTYRRDQEVCIAILRSLLPMVRCLGQNEEDTEEMSDVEGQLINVIYAFWHLTKEGKYTAAVRVALVNCMKTLIEVDPLSKWAIFTVGETELSVRDAFSEFLADTHQQVRILAAQAANRLFHDMKLQGLPVKLQQKAFDKAYINVHEGMNRLARSCPDPEDLPDETHNRNSTLLMLVSVILLSSPVCEKQALFAICHSMKQNKLDLTYIRKVLEKVSVTLGYSNMKDFMTSHLVYLVVEWFRIKVPDYYLPTFPYTLLDYPTLKDFYRSCYKVLIPPLVMGGKFDEIKSMAQCIEEDWKVLLADCFPIILVNILPYFASECSSDPEKTNRDAATRVYDLLRNDNCLGAQQIDDLIQRNLPDIVVELLMTLYESPKDGEPNQSDFLQYIRELDPAPNPPYFPSSVIKATLNYISSCHKSKQNSIISILSKTPDAFQKILLSICKQGAESNNIHKKHRMLIIYHLFVNLLLAEIKDGLGGAWAFVLRDVIYTLIHHINSRVVCPTNDVCARSTLLCLDLLYRVCKAAVTYCKDALESHLPVIVGSLIPLANCQAEIQEQVCNLLTFLIVESQNNENLYHMIKVLDPFPDHPLFRNLRQTHQKIKYSKGAFSLIEEVNHFLSVSVGDSLPLTRLEGLNDLRKQLQQHKDEMKDIVRDLQGNPQNSVIPKLVMSLLELSKKAADLDNGKDVLEAVGSCLGELGPIDFCTIALQHRKDLLYGRAGDVFEDKGLQCVLVIMMLINNALTDHCIHVRSAAATCLKNILATKTGCQFWDSYKNKGDPMLMYLQPFRTAKKKFLQVDDVLMLCRTDGSFDSVDDHNIWIPQNSNHEDWIKNLTCTLLESGGVKSEVLLLLKPMCEVKADFCQAVLPYIIHNILICDPSNTWRTLLSKHIKGFFSSCCRSTSTSSRSATPASSDSESEYLARGTVNMASRRTMLSIVEYLRKQRRLGQGTAFDDNFWLDLNYLEVAMAVQSCAAHFTALLYTEIYADKIKLDGEKSKSTARKTLKFEEESQTMTIVSISEKSKEETGISLQALMMDIYRSIGEPDSLYGCGGGKMLHPLARIQTYEHEAKWGKALVTYDLETNLTPATRQAGIMQALQNFGLCHTLSTYLRGIEHENPEWSSELQEIRFQAIWRNMQWDESPSYKNVGTGPGYHESLYCALQSLRDKEFPTFHDHIKFARVKEVEELCKGSLESVYSLYPTLCRLQTIEELANAGQMFSRPITEHQLNDLYMKWQQQSQLLKDSDFGFKEPVLALRSVILETMLEKNVSSPDCLNQILTKHLVQLSRVSRLANNTQLSEKAMFQIKQHNSAQFLVSEWQLEEAQVFWAKKEQSLALGLLRQMVDKLETNSFEVENNPNLQLIYVECLRLCGNWLSETCLESPTVIMQNYLEKAVEVAESYSTGSCDRLQEGRMKAFLSLARFSDAQYQRIDNYMKSSEFENKQALLAKAKEEVELMRHHKVQTNRYTIKVQRELELDECAISALKEDRKHFLCTAIRNYISCLVSGEEHDMWIFRLCSLWLENSGLSEVNSIMKKDSQKIPSHKFLPLMYQLAARMGTKKMGRQDFHEVLNNVISQTSLDHPYHTLFIILALANANKDDLLLKSEVAKRGRLAKNVPKKISQTDEDRMEAACNIVNTIKKHRPQMVRDVERLCEAYIILANMDANQWKSHRKGIPIPQDQPITKLNNLQDVVIPTMELKVDPSGKYENLVTITSFKPEFRLAGGLNLPKIIDCVGSDGKERRQLVKGRDDLRQDAVMQQVFQMCNTLLQRDSETRKRKLSIRRYKVVPLSQRSGVLEWCSGTVPIGEYLVNADDGAHKRYRPSDLTSLQCQKRMMDVQRARFEEKYQAFVDLSERFRPVFRYFCMEKFLDPAVWFERRLAYTRSVATSSIVGYIVGLGDRHVQNILIDEETAELVHIDLGVAFEQGKILPTPETVPFRLTRDIVDGMGITGVEGVFRRCCEKTMEVMRRSQDALLTIVEVLLYDPLFDWTMNPLKALYLQQDEADLTATLPDDSECNRNSCNDTQSFNKVAERVLLRLQEKLKGVEEGTVLNAEGQVNLLIQQAMDPKNLSKLFPGWKAWV